MAAQHVVEQQAMGLLGPTERFQTALGEWRLIIASNRQVHL
jgi:hypothetical protein